jgi:hypothetical protein
MDAAPPETPSATPPAGGFGGARPHAFGRAAPPQPPKAGLGRAIVVTLVTILGVLLLIGTLGVVAMVGLRKYLSGAKSSEVKNTLGQLTKDAIMGFERERFDPSAPPGTFTREPCASASSPVPRDTASIRGRKYQSTPEEWNVDRARDAGFACLKFEFTIPQYYQYRYEATPTSFLAGGRGDMNGDGRLSDFTITGEVRDGRLVPATSINEVDPEE